MSDWLECIGGPLDGQYAEMFGLGAFAWPSGWYYAKRRWLTDSSWEVVYLWNAEPGFYIPNDHERWLAGDRPRVVATAPGGIVRAYDGFNIDEGRE